jgi:hypothetical protein
MEMERLFDLKKKKIKDLVIDQNAPEKELVNFKVHSGMPGAGVPEKTACTILKKSAQRRNETGADV